MFCCIGIRIGLLEAVGVWFRSKSPDVTHESGGIHCGKPDEVGLKTGVGFAKQSGEHT